MYSTEYTHVLTYIINIHADDAGLSNLKHSYTSILTCGSRPPSCRN